MKSTRLKLFSLLAVTIAACSGASSAPLGSQASAQTSDAGDDAAAACVTDAGDSGDAGTAVSTAIAAKVKRTDIVSNGTGAVAQDATLLNAWGLAFNPQGIAWVSANGSGQSGVYTARGTQAIPPVTIPAPQGAEGPSTPTGQVFNANASAFKGDRFIFVTEDGTVSGWAPATNGGKNPTSATMRVDNSSMDAIYKGVTIASVGGKTRLFAANFKGGTVDVFDDAYGTVQTRGGFRDPTLPSGFAPFNVVEAQNALIVTYAMQDDAKEDDVKGAGLGYVDLFTFDGELIVRLISQGALNAPWGIAVSGSSFGSVPFRMFVGNFGDGMINVYQLRNVDGLARLVHEGVVGDASSGQPLVIDGLWALGFGPDANGFSSSSLYFTAGPNDEKDGVFGKLDLQ